MANSLLDFVMSVVRDPDDGCPLCGQSGTGHRRRPPHRGDHCRRRQSDSRRRGIVPVGGALAGLDVFGDVLGDAGANVWASGAATAAFDAFDDQLPVRGLDDTASTVIDTGDPAVPALVTDDDPALALDAPVVDDVPVR